MEIIVNGEPRHIDEGTTVAALVDQLGMEGERVAVELDRVIVRRAAWSERILTDGAKLEIVHFVGGG